MKNILIITSCLLAFLLCLTAAHAKTIPSVTIGDMTQVDVDVENPQDVGFYLRTVAESEVEYAAHWDACRSEIANISAAESLQSYFKNAKDVQGLPFEVAAFLDAENLYCHELTPVIAGNYTDELGLVTARFLFPTPYEKGEQVVVMIGLISTDENGAQVVQWIAHPGSAVEAADQSIRIETVLAPETVMDIQKGIALLAVLSR
ncbi:MAG: hypothetical protein IJ392_06995 [Clostridia bacterium]|nr:hypothetical protein [Clostridia bacterium]